MFKKFLVRSNQNGVQRCGNRKNLPATRSTYTSNKTYCVKGHRAGRLFKHNNKMIEKKFRYENNLPNNAEEQLISQALAERPKVEEEVRKDAQERLAEATKIGDPKYRQVVIDSNEKAITNPRPRANIILASRYPSIAEKLSQRRIKRNEFLRRPENKICYVCGAKGHVSKECTSKKKMEARERRTIAYKKHLGEKGLYKVDVDATYVKIRKQLEQLKLDNAALIKENISLRHDNENLVSKVHLSREVVEEARPTSEDEKITSNNPGLLVMANHVEYQVTGCLKESDKRSSEMDGQSNSRCSLAQRTLLVIGLLAAVLGIIILIVNIARSGSTPIYSACMLATYAMNSVKMITRTAFQVIIKLVCVLFYMVTGLITLPYHVLSWLSLTKLILTVGFMLSIIYIKSAFASKIDGMISWKAMEMYRDQLKAAGYTFRLPYKISQIGTSDCPGTRLDAYELCYTAVTAAATPVTVVCMYVKALFYCIRYFIVNIRGKFIFFFRRIKGMVKRTIRLLTKIIRFAVLFMLGLLVGIVTISVKILRILISIVFTKKFATLALVVSVVYFARVYVIGHIIDVIMQFTVTCGLLRAKLVHIFSTMTLITTRLVQLITAGCSHIKVHDIIDILVKKIEHLLEFK